MARRKLLPKQINWRLTQRVREALCQGHYVISDHVEGNLPRLGLSVERFLEIIAGGVVLPHREKDETRQATDGYKHFLVALAPSGAIIEVVLKFIASKKWPHEELVLLITVYLGKA